MEKTPGKPQTAVVAGATGAVGEGVVLALISAGWHVHALGRNRDKLNSLMKRAAVHAQALLSIHVQDFEDEASTCRVCQRVMAHTDKVDMVIASIGGWWQGATIVQMPFADWRKVMQSNLDAHFLCAQQWWPVLLKQPQSAYVMINGGAALSPVPHAGAVSVAAAAQLMLKNVLATESHRHAPRVYSVLANTPVITRDRSQGQASWLNTQDLAAACLACFEDSDGLHHGATLVLNEKTAQAIDNNVEPIHWRWFDRSGSFGQA
jgi:NAD(P)-dependent dehydrogenase (short-subunit alcohol dehydrogenase family)